jgi:hypothetical protein
MEPRTPSGRKSQAGKFRKYGDRYKGKYKYRTNREIDLGSDRGAAVSGSWVLCTDHGLVPVVDFSYGQMRLGCRCSRAGLPPQIRLHRVAKIEKTARADAHREMGL